MNVFNLLFYSVVPFLSFSQSIRGTCFQSSFLFSCAIFVILTVYSRYFKIVSIFGLYFQTVNAAQDSPCDYHLEIEGASKDLNVQDSISYSCEEGMYFDDSYKTKQTPCTCDSIDEVLSWGTCATPPPDTGEPYLFFLSVDYMDIVSTAEAI